MQPTIGKLFGAAFAVSLSAAATALAAEAILLPREQTQGPVSFLAGGVGVEEVKAIEKVANSYPLTLEFCVKSSPRSEFVANVKVKITNHEGKLVLETLSQGPLLLAKLPPGKYSVTAEFRGETKTRSVNLAEKRHRRVVFEWLTEMTKGAATPMTRG